MVDADRRRVWPWLFEATPLRSLCTTIAKEHVTREADFIHWITRSVAGLRQPGLHSDLRSDLAAIRQAGINVLVSLTVQPIAEPELLNFGIHGRHFPIIGMGVPRLAATLALIEDLTRTARAGQKLAFHCTEGVGRTGMMLACHLVYRGKTADAAIVRVRERIPRAIQTAQQEAFVRRFAARLTEVRATAPTRQTEQTAQTHLQSRRGAKEQG